MSLNTIIDDLYDRVEDFCIDDILVESDVELMGDDISLCEGDDDIEDIEDTLTILNNYIDGLEIQGKKKPLAELMSSLYNEALDEHNYL